MFLALAVLLWHPVTLVGMIALTILALKSKTLLSWLAALAVMGGMAIQQNLGAFNLNAWQQAMQIAGAQFNTDAGAGAHVIPPNLVHGALQNYIAVTGVGAANYTTRTAAQMAADLVAQIGYPFNASTGWEVTFTNTSGGQFTLVGGTGVTITGTATVANNASRTYFVTWNGASGAAAAFTFTNVASGTN